VAYIQAGTVVECYATGAVAGTSAAGGLAGFSSNGDAVTRCYWDMDRSGLTTSAGGEGRTTAQMRQQSTYVDWDFQAQWGIAPDWNDGYPFTPRPGFWRVRFLAVGNGEVVGATSQVVANGEDAMSVTAVSAYGFTFARWEEDGSTENPRTLTHVTSDMTLTATFREANARAANGVFRAKVAGAGRGLWDLTDAYSTTVKGNPLTLNLVHDPSGKLSGTATYTMAPYTPISMPIKGSVRGTRGSITMKGALRGADSGKTVAVTLLLDLTVDTANHRLVGRLTGSFRSNSTTTPVDDPVLLDIPQTMDGTWTLEFDLDQSGRKVTGTATLTLANDVQHTFFVRGKTGANRTAVLSLAGDPSDPASMPISIRTTITPLEGGWARIESLAGRGYGQTLGW
jgi:hypothetical protein